MNHARHLSLALAAIAAVLVAVACHDAASPQGPITAGILPPGPKHDKGGNQCANFRLTGGGRVDQRDHLGYEKNTPVNASAARQAEVGALIPSLVVLGPRGQDARGDGTLRTRGVVARYGNKHRRDRRQRQREMSRVVHENSSFWCTAVRA